MFTKITLKNFRSYKQAVFDLSDRNNKPKKIAFLYGENGAGKSNLMSSFVLLLELMNTMKQRDNYEYFMREAEQFSDNNEAKEYFIQSLLSRLRDMKAIINDIRMIGCEEEITISYDFVINGSSGSYSIAFGTEELVYEKLEYKLNSRRGALFECTGDYIKVNPAIASNNDFLKDVKSAAKRFWGKHSMLAIILHEIEDKSNAFAKDAISECLNTVLNEFGCISCEVKIGDRYWSSPNIGNPALEEPESGEISIDEENQLERAAQIISILFCSINSDYEGAKFKKKYSEKKIEYELLLEKKVNKTIIEIPFSKESTGNRKLLHTFCKMLPACDGKVSVIDEGDAGVHDLLFQKVLKDIVPYINGQLICSTHNTMLLELPISHIAAYFLKENIEGDIVISAVTDAEKRLYITNNLRNKYICGEYGGIPTVKDIDFSEIINIL